MAYSAKYMRRRVKINILAALLALIFNSVVIGEICASVPENVRVSNVSKDKFTVSWTTDVSEAGSIAYGDTSSLGGSSVDSRGELFEGVTHYVTVTGLASGTVYYYDIVSGGVTYDNSAAHYTAATGAILSPAADTDLAYGQVFLADGSTPAEGAIVYITLRDGDDAGTGGDSQLCSSLVGSTGYWYFNLKNIRNRALTSYFDYSASGDSLVLEAKGPDGSASLQVADTSADTPAQALTLEPNSPPVLEWTGEAGYEADGLDPEAGFCSTDFTFSIKYIDADGDEPQVHKVYIDKNGDGDYSDAGEENDMTPGGTGYASGVVYTYATAIPYSQGSQNCSYFFAFSDGLEFASGSITQGISEATAINKPDVFQSLSLAIDRTDWQLVNIAAGSAHVTAGSDKVTVTNDGDGPQSYSLQITDAGGSWSAATGKNGADVNTYVLSALLTGDSEAGIDSSYFNEIADDDVVTSGSAGTASSARFGSSRASQDGASVPSGETRALWFEFKAPAKDTTRGQPHSIGVTITAEAS